MRPSLADAIRSKALALGFDAVGIGRAELAPQARTKLVEFLAAGGHGTMDWLAERVDERSQPRVLWSDARSVISLAINYGPDSDPLENLNRPAIGNISVYARNRDYHDVVKGMLKHLAQFIVSQVQSDVKVFVDTAPVMEKPLGAQAGLGWQGKHTNLVSRSFGSWLFLSEIYTTLELPPSDPAMDRCGSCQRCLAICPTAAFPAPYRLDATRCISYLTIEHRGPIPHALRPAIGNRIYGCDDCLAVCPWNRFAKVSQHAKLTARDDLRAPRLDHLATMTDEAFRQRFSASPVKRIGRSRFMRNVAVAIGNSGEPALLASAQALAGDSDPVVAEAGRWAAERLMP